MKEKRDGRALYDWKIDQQEEIRDAIILKNESITLWKFVLFFYKSLSKFMWFLQTLCFYDLSLVLRE